MNLPSPQPDQRPLVLVVDDTPDVHRLLSVKLRCEDLCLAHATSGEQALTMIRDLAPAAVLLDIDMPHMDGLTVLRKLKADPTLHHIPVLMLSAIAGPEQKATAFDLGAVDYITKPFEWTELQVRLRSALRMRELIQLLAQRAQIDGLTGLWNRAHFDQAWHQAHARASRHEHPLSLAFFDIDHFKDINDRFGHPVGDEVLVGLSRILRRESRVTDSACRYGGEEFVLIMPDTQLRDALTVCERIRAAVEASQWAVNGHLMVTVSAGVVGCGSAMDVEPAAWLESADRNLYAAKHSGRNRIVSSTPAAGVASRAA